jgi:hypothetical protein
MRYSMERLPGGDLWAVIDSVTRKPALVNDVPQIDLDLDDADDLTCSTGSIEKLAQALSTDEQRSNHQEIASLPCGRASSAMKA